MRTTRLLAARALVRDALDLPPSQRARYLDAACATRPELHAEARAMLACHSESTRLDDAVGSVRRAVLPRTGARIADRYVLGERLGEGTFGVVHAATDERGGGQVAVKLLSLTPGAATPTQARLELAALRRARLPGVVELLDDGRHGDSVHFLVMRLVEGRPFPSVERRHDWTELEPLVDSLLRALGRLHWLGVLHRDLKPANVLAGGRGVTLVDLGLAVDTELDADLLPCLAGTPDFMAPELFLGREPSVRSDLYAVGVMLWHALAGRRIHDVPSVDELVRRSTAGDVPRLSELRDDLPHAVVDTVAALVARDPDDRPSSAIEAARRLRLRPSVEPLPRLGSAATLDRLVETLEQRESLFVAGSRGSGRSRLLADARQRLESDGYLARVLTPGNAPFSSFDAVVQDEPPADLTLAAATEWVTERVEARVRMGEILLCDDVEDFDPASRAVLDRVAHLGRVARVVEQADADEARVLRVEPLTQDDLWAVFQGPDQLLHLREDGARALFERTDGLPARIVEELARWEADKLARREDDLYVVTRVALDRLLADDVRPPTVPAAPDVQIDGLAVHVQRLLELAGTWLSLPALARLAGLDRFVLDTVIAQLCEAGFVRDDEGGVRAVASLGPDLALDDKDRRRLHARIADELGSRVRPRFAHLVAAGRHQDAVRCVVTADPHAAGSRGAAGFDLALDVVRLAFDDLGCPDDLRERAVVHLAFAALRGNPGRNADLALAVLDRMPSLPPRARVARDLLHVVRQEQAIGGDRALADLGPPPDWPELRRLHHMVAVQASRSLGEERHREYLLPALREFRTSDSLQDRYVARHWLGWYRYRRLEFTRAARLHRRAGRYARSPFAKLNAQVDEAVALVETARCADVVELARTATALAARLRSPVQEIRARRIGFDAAYRTDHPDRFVEPDWTALQAFGSPYYEGLFRLTAAAVAWRAGRLKIAREQASASYDCLSRARRPVAWLAAALREACSPQPQHLERGHDELAPWPRLQMQFDALQRRDSATCPPTQLRCRDRHVGPPRLEVLDTGRRNGTAAPHLRVHPT